MTPFGEIVATFVVILVVICVTFVTGVAAVTWLIIVAVLTSVVVFPFGVEVMSDVSVERTVLTWETVLGVLVLSDKSKTVIVKYFVVGAGVTRANAVIFDVTSFVDIEDSPWIVNVVETTSFIVIVVAFAPGMIVE